MNIFSWKLKFYVGFFNAFLLEKYYIKITFLNVHDGRIMHRLRCSGIFGKYCRITDALWSCRLDRYVGFGHIVLHIYYSFDPCTVTCLWKDITNLAISGLELQTSCSANQEIDNYTYATLLCRCIYFRQSVLDVFILAMQLLRVVTFILNIYNRDFILCRSRQFWLQSF